MEKENFINEILNSTAQIQRVAPSDGLFLKIEQRIAEQAKVSTSTLWWVAASVAVLIALNVAAFTFEKRTPERPSAEAFGVVLDHTNQLY